MSEYELTHQIDFPVHILKLMGNEIVQGEGSKIVTILRMAAKTLSAIHKYKDTKAKFKEIDQGFSQIQEEIAQLQEEIVELGQQLNLDISELEQFYTSGIMNTYFTDIASVMDSSTHNGLRYYSSEGARYQAGQITEQEMNQDTALARSFAFEVYMASPQFAVCNWSEQLHALICPPSGFPQNNALTTYANVIIQKATPQGLSDSASMMKLYLLLENYFLQVVNNQFQCVTVWTNACNFYDTTGHQAELYYKGTFTTDIKQEINAFLNTVDYMMVNLGEYRTTTRFKNDMDYFANGLAPDNVFIHVLARAQFVANLLYDALGIAAPVMCGHILTPYNYTNGTLPVVSTVSVKIDGGSKTSLLTSQANVIAGQLPYTYWVGGDPAICHPDNNWSVYRFGTPGVPDSGWQTSPCTLVIEDNDNIRTPWVHYIDIKGKVTPLFYNPRNPSQTSKTYTPECNVEFAYFSALWPWGFFWMTNSEGYWHRTGYFDFFSFNDDFLLCSTYAPPVAGSLGSTAKLDAFFPQTDAEFYYDVNTPWDMELNGNTASTPYYYLVADNYYCNVKTGGELPAIKGYLKAWGTYTVYYNMKGIQGDLIRIDMGLGIDKKQYPHCQYPTYKIQGNVVSALYISQAGVYNTGLGLSSDLSPNYGYQPGVQYFYQTLNLPEAVPAEIYFSQCFQMVYGGMYSFPPE